MVANKHGKEVRDAIKEELRRKRDTNQFNNKDDEISDLTLKLKKAKHSEMLWYM